MQFLNIRALIAWIFPTIEMRYENVSFMLLQSQMQKNLNIGLWSRTLAYKNNHKNYHQ